MATPETIDRDLDILFELWRTKWIGRQGQGTHRAADPRDAPIADGQLQGRHLDVRGGCWYGDRPLGALANIVDRQKKSILFITGRDETWKTPSPGLILHGYCIRRAIADGFQDIRLPARQRAL